MSQEANYSLRLSPADRRFVRVLLDEYLVREFGEEMAGVCKLPYEQRIAYIADMFDYARECGVNFDKPATGVQR
jgi:hypothetical protein